MNSISELKEFFYELSKLGIRKVVLRQREFDRYEAIILANSDFMSIGNINNYTSNEDRQAAEDLFGYKPIESFRIFGVQVEKE